jgi:hypothetical protein
MAHLRLVDDHLARDELKHSDLNPLANPGERWNALKSDLGKDDCLLTGSVIKGSFSGNVNARNGGRVLSGQIFFSLRRASSTRKG